jgi:PAS domain-containing protein
LIVSFVRTRAAALDACACFAVIALAEPATAETLRLAGTGSAPLSRWKAASKSRCFRASAAVNGGSIDVRIDITELKQREQELRAQNLRFDTALNNMSQGLTMFDAEQRLVVCNERYASIYGLPPELTRPGTTFQQILDHRIANRIYSLDSPENYARELLSTIRGKIEIAA